MLNTNRPHAFNHWCVVPPSACEHFQLLALSSGTFYRSKWRRRHPWKSSAAQATEDLLIHAVALGQTHALSCVLLLFCFIYCTTVVLAVFLLGHFLRLCSIGWMTDWSRRCFAPDVNLSSNGFVVADANTPRWAAGVFVRCGWCWSSWSWWTGLTSSC